MKTLVLVTVVAAGLLAAAGFVGAAQESTATGKPTSAAVPEKPRPTKKLGVPEGRTVRKDAILQLPVCSAAGTLAWDAALLAKNQTPPPGVAGWTPAKSAYSGQVTITANRDFLAFKVLLMQAAKTFTGNDDPSGYSCGGAYGAQETNLKKGQSRVYAVQCVWSGNEPPPLEGKAKVGYSFLRTDGTTSDQNIGFCEGRYTLVK